MSDPDVRNLSNSFLAVRLLALHEFPDTADLGVGPFLVVQHGIDPSNPCLEPDHFLLTRDGAWLPIVAFLGLPLQERRDRACFPDAAEVMNLLEQLPPRPRVVHENSLPTDEACERSELVPSDDDADAALRRAVRWVVPPSPDSSTGNSPP